MYGFRKGWREAKWGVLVVGMLFAGTGMPYSFMAMTFMACVLAGEVALFFWTRRSLQPVLDKRHCAAAVLLTFACLLAGRFLLWPVLYRPSPPAPPPNVSGMPDFVWRTAPDGTEIQMTNAAKTMAEMRHTTRVTLQESADRMRWESTWTHKPWVPFWLFVMAIGLCGTGYRCPPAVCAGASPVHADAGAKAK